MRKVPIGHFLTTDRDGTTITTCHMSEGWGNWYRISNGFITHAEF